MKLINSVVCYNNHTEVISFAKSLSELSNSHLIVLVISINQLSTDNLINLKESLKKIKLSTFINETNTNLGYLNGMIFGIKNFLTLNPEFQFDYALFSNTDVSFSRNDFLFKLMNKSYPSDYWAIGPVVFSSATKSNANPVAKVRRSKKEMDKLIFIFSTPLINYLYYFLSLVKSKLFKKYDLISKEVYEIHGSFMILKKDLVYELFNKPFKGFLYSEEAFISEIVFQSHKKVFYDSTLVVNHNEHSVTRFLGIKLKLKYIADSLKSVNEDFYK